VILTSVLAKTEQDDLSRAQRNALAGLVAQLRARIREQEAPMNDESGPAFGDEMIADLRGLVDALRSGEPLEKRYTVRTVRIDLEPKTYGPEEIKAVRARFGASQALLAKFLGVGVQAVRKWEQGERRVPAMAARHLDDLQEFPDIWARRVRFVEK